ncbi:MAG: energy transducer TonB [Gammaproteobacteria bacterium]
MRFLLAMVGGLLITLAMLVIGLNFFDDPPSKASLRKGVEVAPLPTHHKVDVAEWVRETRGDLPEPIDGEPVARLPAPPPVKFLRDDIDGFVQVRFTVQPDGSASDVRVFGAVPAGYYEQQAIDQVRARRWEPGVDGDGNRVPRDATEVVRFTLPADTPRRVNR